MARPRQGRERAVNAVALIEEDPRDGNSAVSGGHMTDRPKSDGVTAEQTCPARRVRMSAVSFTKGKGSVPGPRGVWWGWPYTEVGFHPTILTFGRMSKLFLLSLNRMVRPLSLASQSPRGEVKAVWSPP